MTVLLVSAAALVDEAGRVLVQRRASGRSMAGLWEFPGGKVEPGETPEAALVREIGEELGIALDPAALEPIAFASAPLGERRLVLLLYSCRRWAGEPVALDADALAWHRPAELRQLAMTPADVPLIDALERLLKPNQHREGHPLKSDWLSLSKPTSSSSVSLKKEVRGFDKLSQSGGGEWPG